MKKILVLLFVSCNLLTKAQSINDLDQKYGFREMHFEDSISLYPALKSFDQTKDSLYIFYRKTGEDTKIGDALVDIVYTFYKGQFSTILIKTSDSISSRRLLKNCQDLYGKGFQEDPYIEKHRWNGRSVIMSYYESINTFEASLYISSIKMKLKAEGRDKY